MATIPIHVRLVVSAVSFLFFAAGLRDIIAPGTALPLPGDDQLMLAVWGATPYSPTAKMIIMSWGGFLISLSATKIVTVFSLSHPSGTLLRRNLFALFGMQDLFFAAVFITSEVALKDKGASVMPFVGAFLLEGLVLLVDGASCTNLIKVGKTK